EVAGVLADDLLGGDQPVVHTDEVGDVGCLCRGRVDEVVAELFRAAPVRRMACLVPPVGGDVNTGRAHVGQRNSPLWRWHRIVPSDVATVSVRRGRAVRMARPLPIVVRAAETATAGAAVPTASV